MNNITWEIQMSQQRYDRGMADAKKGLKLDQVAYCWRNCSEYVDGFNAATEQGIPAKQTHWTLR
jgi:hypothetical protein